MLDEPITPVADPFVYGSFRRPWWTRTWLWVLVSVTVIGVLLAVGASATAAGGCGGG